MGGFSIAMLVHPDFRRASPWTSGAAPSVALAPSPASAPATATSRAAAQRTWARARRRRSPWPVRGGRSESVHPSGYV